MRNARDLNLSSCDHIALSTWCLLLGLTISYASPVLQAQEASVGAAPAKRHFTFLDNQPMDVECRAFLDAMASQKSRSWDEMTPTEAREQFASLKSLFGTGPKTVTTEAVELGSEIPCRIFRPATPAPQSGYPVAVLFHGGGWVLGDLDTHDAMCRRIAAHSQCAVVAVNYRLAPEHPFPAAFDDCYQATKSISEKAKQFGLDGSRIVVVGDSAGGTLAACVAIKARNMSGPKLVGQVLIYPAIDHSCSSASYAAYAEGYGLTRKSMQWFWQQYLADRRPHVYTSPSMANTLSGLPQTVIITAEYDVLRDEGEDFAERLHAAGVKTDLHRVSGVIHGFVHFAGAFKIGEQTTIEISNKIKHIVSAPSN